MTDELHDEDVTTTEAAPEENAPETEDLADSPEDRDEPESQEEQEVSEVVPASGNFKRRVASAILLVFALGLGFLIGRNTEPAQDAPEQHAHAGEDGKGSAEETWTCSMHPQIRSPEPGSCPICGMDLIPASSDDAGPALTSSQVRLSERAKSLARIQTEEVTTTSQDRSSRQLFGQVVENEGAKRSITSWISGRVDRLLVSTTGERVRRGQTLAKMYSPEVYAAHQDLLVAKQQLERLSGKDPYAERAANAQVSSALQRLRLLGFTDSELKKMEGADKPWTQVSVRSTATGTVLDRKVSQGEYIQKGAVLFEISDLTTVWIELDAYESDLELIEVGQEVTLLVDALAEPSRKGKITFIDPVLDPKTRVASVRVEVENKDQRIKPGMYARAMLEPELIKPGQPLPLAIPRSAPLFAGDRSLVYVEVSSQQEGTTYEAREVILGARQGDSYIVKAGLSRGDRVVTHGAFVLDSDLQIRGGSSLMERSDDTSRPAAKPPLEVSAKDREALSLVFSGYLDVQEHLANDELDKALERTKSWREAVSKVSLEGAETQRVWSTLSRRMEQDLMTLERASQIADARASFESLTQLFDEALARFGNVLDTPIRKTFCPMANDNKGAHWYQRAPQVDNVYFGNQMRRCGEIQRTIDAGEHLLSDASGVHVQGGTHEH